MYSRIYYLFTILFILKICVIIYFFKIKEKNKMKDALNIHVMNMELIKNFTCYISVLEYFLNKAYDIIFKDQIMIYSIEATKLDDKHFEEISKQFITLVLKLIGPMMQNEFEYLYGNRSTLLFNITEYFNRRYEDDEVRKTSQQNLMDDEEDTV